MKLITNNANSGEAAKPRFISEASYSQDSPKTREAAIALGLKYYRPGIPCRHGHIEGRYVRDASCVQCNRLRTRKWSLENPSKRRVTKRKQMRSYRAKNPDQMAAWAAWSSARSRGASVPEGTTIAETVKATIPLYREARELSKVTGIRHEVDHIIAINRGGLHALDNLQVVRRSFNAAKRRLTNDEVLAEVIAGEWRHEIGPEVLKITKDRLTELIEDHEKQDALGTLTAQGFLHRIETDPTYRPSVQTIQAVFERLQNEVTLH